MKQKVQKVIDLKEFLPYRLSVLEQQISHSISRKYDDRFNLSRMQWRVLATLAMFDGITAKDICGFTHMEKMQASRAISSLESRGLVHQSKSPVDNRAHVLSLSSAGKNVYRQIVPEVLAEEQRIFSCLSHDEIDSLQGLVDKLYRSLES